MSLESIQMSIVSTPSLVLRKMEKDDADFLLQLMNEPDYHRYIGDRGVRTLDDAKAYIQSRFIDNYERLGYGLYAVEERAENRLVGICGLVKRDELPVADLGFAFLSAYRSRGFAYEAAQATLAYARQTLKMDRLMAITSQDNEASKRLLIKLGFAFQEHIHMQHKNESLELFVSSAGPSSS